MAGAMLQATPDARDFVRENCGAYANLARASASQAYDIHDVVLHHHEQVLAR